MEKVIEKVKVDTAVRPASIASTAIVGQYYSMAKYRRALFAFNAAAMATGETVVGQVMQATSAAGANAKVVTNFAATITAETKVKQATITLATFTAGSVVVINGITFTAHATVTTYANREFSISGNDTADAAELVSCINHATYGVSGVLASSSAGVVSLRCTEPGSGYLTVVGVITIGVAATVSADGIVEVQAEDLDINNSFTHVALRITTTGTIIASAMLLRGDSRENPVQFLAAEYS